MLFIIPRVVLKMLSRVYSIVSYRLKGDPTPRKLAIFGHHMIKVWSMIKLRNLKETGISSKMCTCCQCG